MSRPFSFLVQNNSAMEMLLNPSLLCRFIMGFKRSLLLKLRKTYRHILTVLRTLYTVKMKKCLYVYILKKSVSRPPFFLSSLLPFQNDRQSLPQTWSGSVSLRRHPRLQRTRVVHLAECSHSGRRIQRGNLHHQQPRGVQVYRGKLQVSSFEGKKL